MHKNLLFDFDGTVYDGDSSIDFFIFCLKKNKKIIKYLPIIFFFSILKFLRLINTKKFKEIFFSFLKDIDNIDSYLKDFSLKNSFKIKQFFKEICLDKSNSITIITASPEFLVKSFFGNANINVIGTDMNKKNGEINGENCKGNVKLKKMQRETNKRIDEFYSDSFSDYPIVEISDNSFIVNKNNIIKWSNDYFERKKIKRNSIILFLTFFSFYILLGIFLSVNTYVRSNMDLLFGTDTLRVGLDMSDIYYDHYRTRVHPLFVLFTQPLVFLINGITHNLFISMNILLSFAGALCVTLIYIICKKFEHNNKFSIIISIIFGFSFSNMIFSSSTEVYIFAMLFLMLLWIVVINILKRDFFTRNDFIYLVLLSIMCLGITITNYIVFLIACFILLISKKVKLKEIVLINIISIVILIFLSFFQNAVWHNTAVIYGNANTNYSEENLYIDKNPKMQNLKNIVKNDLINPIVASGIYLGHSENNLNTKIVYFTTPNIVTIIFILLILLLFLIMMLKNFKYNKLINLGLILTLIFNSLLHIIYGNNSSFIYASHFIYIYFMLFVINFRCNNHKIKFINIFMLVFCLLQLFFNIKTFSKLVNIVGNIVGINYFATFWNSFSIIAFSLLIMIICYTMIYIIYINFKKISISSNSNKFICLLKIICALIIISSLFISIETIEKYNKLLNFDISFLVNK